MTGESGRDIGKSHLATLEAFLGSGQLLPVSAKDGTLNITALVKATGIPRSSFYQNENIERLLEHARKQQRVKRQGEAEVESRVDLSQPEQDSTGALVRSDPKSKAMERRMHRLEQQNAALVAENFALRSQVKQLNLQLGRDDMQIETGRRIPPPTATS